jgi:hypothetical protein
MTITRNYKTLERSSGHHHRIRNKFLPYRGKNRLNCCYQSLSMKAANDICNFAHKKDLLFKAGKGQKPYKTRPSAHLNLQ